MTTEELFEARRAIIDKYARMRPYGTSGPQPARRRPVFCSPSKAERGGAERRKQAANADGKVIFPDLVTAESARRELEALDGAQMYAYVCNRSRHGHAHLARQATPRERRMLREGST